jgi:hypothetical protein
MPPGVVLKFPATSVPSSPKGNIMSDSSSSSGGIGFAGLLTILFIGLKLTHYISWSWWWVLSPLWIGFAVGAVILVVFGILTWLLDR